MKLYLIQHGESVSKDINPDRPLTDKGEMDIKRLAKFLRDNGTSVSDILHSGKTRARQTAEILAAELLECGETGKMKGISPNDPVAPFAATIPDLGSGAMIVGHLPFMAKLVSYLVSNQENPVVVNFRPGSIVCLEQDDDTTWKIQWMIRPDCF